MRLATYLEDGVACLGIVEGDRLIPVAGASWMALMESAVSLHDHVRSHRRDRDSLTLEAVHLLPPIPMPRKFLALGGNYASHLAETAKVGIHRGINQIWFNKQVTCLAGPYDPVWKPSISDQFDYEGELGVVIGRRCRRAKAADWREYVAGYLVVNDMSVRDWQMRAPTHMIGKSFDTHGPCGPWMVTADAIADPHALSLKTWVNGALRQSASTAEMIHTIGEMIEELSTAFTLEPGDILSTGSPAGVGGLMEPPCYLEADDVVRVEIEGIGFIENRVVEEPVPLPPFSPFGNSQ